SSPFVPPFDPATLTHVHAGGELSTADQRAIFVVIAGHLFPKTPTALRIHADIEVPMPVNITWQTDAQHDLSAFTASFCDPAAPAACGGAKLDGTAVFGARSDISR